jgi:hypothetical protein
VAASGLDRAWREILSGLAAQDVLGPEAAAGLAGLDFTVEYARQHLGALRTVQRALAAYREAQRGPCVVTVQAPGGSARLAQDMPLLADVPCVDKPSTPEDARCVRACVRACVRWRAVSGRMAGCSLLRRSCAVWRWWPGPLPHS